MGMVRGVGVVQGLRPRFFIEHTCNEGVRVGRGVMKMILLSYIAWSCAFPGVDHGYSVQYVEFGANHYQIIHPSMAFNLFCSRPLRQHISVTGFHYVVVKIPIYKMATDSARLTMTPGPPHLISSRLTHDDLSVQGPL